MYRKTIRLFLKCVLLLCAAVFVLCALLLFWAERNEDILTAHFVQTVQEKLGQPFSLDSVDIVFSPWPVVIGKGLATDGPAFSCSVKKIVAVPSLFSLFTGRFAFDSLFLVEPRFTLRGLFQKVPTEETDPGDVITGFFPAIFSCSGKGYC